MSRHVLRDHRNKTPLTGSAFWIDFWDANADQPDEFRATGLGDMDMVGFLHTVREVARILDFQPSDEVLDIGCGTGIVALALAPFVRRVHGVDLSRRMVERARRNLDGVPNVTLAQASITALEEADVSYDKVLAYSVLQYLGSENSVAAALGEVARVLRSGGRGLLAANPDPARRETYLATIDAEFDEEARKLELELLNETLWVSREDVIRLAARAGLTGDALPISPRIWQHFYMYDLLVVKNG